MFSSKKPRLYHLGCKHFNYFISVCVIIGWQQIMFLVRYFHTSCPRSIGGLFDYIILFYRLSFTDIKNRPIYPTVHFLLYAQILRDWASFSSIYHRVVRGSCRIDVRFLIGLFIFMMIGLLDFSSFLILPTYCWNIALPIFCSNFDFGVIWEWSHCSASFITISNEAMQWGCKIFVFTNFCIPTM